MRLRPPNLLREPGLWIAIAATLGLFQGVLAGETLFFRDLYIYFYPSKAFYAGAVAAGHLPTWDPRLHGGIPYAASPNNSFFHPANVLYLLLPPLAAFNASLVLHHVVAAAGAYWLARELRLGGASSLAAAGIFAWSGPALSATNLMVPMLHGLPFVPLAVAATHRLLRDGGGRWLAAAGAAAAGPLLTGCTELAAATLATCVGWLLVWPRPGLSLGRRSGLAAGMALLAAGLALAQVVPALELLQASSRGEKRSFESFTTWSVNPRRLPELAIPGFFGSTRSLDAHGYRGHRAEDIGFPYIISIYVGLMPLALAATASIRRGLVLPHRGVLLLGWLAGAGILLSLGRFLPGFHLVYDIPFAATVRYPAKALFFALLPIAILAAAGLEGALGPAGRGLSRAACAGIAGIAGIPLAAAATLRASPVAAEALENLFFMAPLAEPDRADLAGALARSGASGLLLAALLARARLAPARWHLPLAVALILADLHAHGGGLNPTAPSDFHDPPAVAATVRQVAEGGRLYRAPMPDGARVTAPTRDVMWQNRFTLDVLADFSASAYGIPVIFHRDFDGMVPRRTLRLGQQVDALPWPARLSILRIAGVRAVITHEALSLPGLTRIAGVEGGGEPAFHLYALQGPGTARFVSRATWVPATDDALALFVRGEASPDRVLLAGSPPPDPRPGCPGGSVDILVDALASRKYRVHAPCDGYLVLAETAFPGWSARVDGRTVDILSADYAFKAVPVPAGTHEVLLAYVPRALLLGLALSGAMAVVLLAIAVTGRPRGLAAPVDDPAPEALT